ncbi:MAG TPA: dihydrofolate reductase family protein [Thermoleophilaceae bacterium]|nr:dihydrofolate reductase family protein [Thermoleophilaceae bacterium]
MRRLFPDPAELEVGELLEGFPPEGPYLALNMVASVDGRATLEGRTTGLGGEADHALFHGLRERVDCVMAGAGTVRAEGYGRVIKTEEARARRQVRGLDAEPVMAVVSRSGAVPLAGAIVGDDPVALVELLRAEHGVRSILCEGGPTLNSSLMDLGLVDELFLTLSPQLVGGRDPLTIVAGPELDPPPQLELLSLVEGGGDLLTRWRFRP